MSKLDDVRALFVPGGAVECVENTYIPDRAGTRYNVRKVGRSVWEPAEHGFRGTFPSRVRDVLRVDADSATWLIGRDEHTVTYRRV